MIRKLLSLTFAITNLVVSETLLAAIPETVRFPSADGKTQLTGYVFEPAESGQHPAIVMLHGRAGPYSSLKPGSYTAQSLSARHRMWGEFWARRRYVAVLVDSFGPRGHPEGFPKHSYKDRPGEVSEQWVRPLDAYGALAYLRSRADVVADRIGLQGWSNGGMTLLSAIASDSPGLKNPHVGGGFRAAVAQYPSCRTQLRQSGYKPYAPLLLFAASEDDEVSPDVCRQFADAMRARGEAVEFVLYDGAHHSYDDPGKTKQRHAPNHAAMLDTQRRVETFFQQHLKP
ncbi:MAG: dienelactone hydrolase family protein [Burkholderiales bacterium]